LQERGAQVHETLRGHLRDDQRQRPARRALRGDRVSGDVLRRQARPGRAAAHRRAGDTQEDRRGDQARAGPVKLLLAALLALVLALGGIGLGAILLGGAAWAWSRNRVSDNLSLGDSGPALDPELDRRVDDELARFDA